MGITAGENKYNNDKTGGNKTEHTNKGCNTVKVKQGTLRQRLRING